MFFDKIYGSWKSTQEEKYKAILERFSAVFSGRVLDIGSGEGYLEKFIERNGVKAEIVRMDMRKPAGIVADGNYLPFRDGSFDSVISIDTMHLINGNDFQRILKKGGLALLAVFFNKENYEERKSLLEKKLLGFGVLSAHTLHGKESEYIVLAKKPNQM